MAKNPKDPSSFNKMVDKIFKKDKKKIRSIMRRADYNTTGFINSEIRRLEKLAILFDEKLPNMQKYPQTKELISLQIEENITNKNTIVSHMIQPGSRTNTSIQHIFNKFFS